MSREPIAHELKIHPQYFEYVRDKTKCFEVRKDDRNYQVGDVLRLKEWNHKTGFSGSYISARVTYILRDPEYVKEGMCIMSIEVLLWKNA